MAMEARSGAPCWGSTELLCSRNSTGNGLSNGARVRCVTSGQAGILSIFRPFYSPPLNREVTRAALELTLGFLGSGSTCPTI